MNFLTLCMAGEALNKKEANLAILTAPVPGESEDHEKEKNPKPQPWDHGTLLPIRIILRDFAATGFLKKGEKATANHLWNFIEQELKDANLKDYAPKLRRELLAKRGRGLILFDGLDEVPEAGELRTQIKNAVEDFAAVYFNCRFIITSRTYAYQKQDWKLKDFHEAVLAAFTKNQIKNFIDRWYEHIANLRKRQKGFYSDQASLLKGAILKNDRLLDLARRPLLLTLMAGLHAWRSGKLPDKREELYCETVDLLLDRWERPKIVKDSFGNVSQQSLAEWLKVDKEKVHALLNELVFKVHAGQTDPQGTADIPEGEIITGLMRLSPNSEINPVKLVDFLSQRSGILVPRGVGVYAFPHRTFQEYMAACYLTDHDYPERLAGLVREDANRWREATLLAAAKAAKGAEFAV